MRPASTSTTRAQHLKLAGTLVLSLCSLWWSVLAIFALFAAFLTWASMPSESGTSRRSWQVALVVALLLGTGGLVRFVSEHALSGMLNAGRKSLDKATVSRLREILFAQDWAREQAIVDPDGDGIGGALFLPALAGVRAPRDARELVQPLDRRFREITDTPIGPASALNGYLYIICLPSHSSLTADPSAPVDEQLAERRFVAYAWPDTRHAGSGKVFSIDEHERIREFANRAGEGWLYSGTARPPPCDAESRQDGEFVAWQGKAARAELPGYEPEHRP